MGQSSPKNWPKCHRRWRGVFKNSVSILKDYLPTNYGRVSWTSLAYTLALSNRQISRTKLLNFKAHSQNCQKGLLASSCPSVRPSVCLSLRMEYLGSHWTDFYETLHLSFIRNSVKKTQVSLKSDKNNGYFTWQHSHINDNISLNS
jgi:hypothetical protein